LIGEVGRLAFDTPIELKPSFENDFLLSLSFNAFELDDPTLIQCCFGFFDQFDIKKFFKITNEQMYLFLSAVRCWCGFRQKH
jgi:hypothetical protein